VNCEQRLHAASAERVRAARKRPAEPEEIDCAKRPKLQQRLVPGQATSHCQVTQSKVDQLVANFVVDYMEPLSVVEAPSFVELVTGLQPTRTVMTRKTLDGKILLRANLQSHILTVPFFVPLVGRLMSAPFGSTMQITVTVGK